MTHIQPLIWKHFHVPQPYQETIQKMEECVALIAQEKEPEQVWCLEHPALYSGGTSADIKDLFNPFHLPFIQTGRGGQITYHGPGQCVFYVMINLKKRNLFVKSYVCLLEKWIITTLRHIGVVATKHPDHIGVWVKHPPIKATNIPASECPLYPEPFDTTAHYKKIAAIGIRIRKYVSYHGVALNINPYMPHFTGIIPCGIQEENLGVTSLHEMQALEDKNKIIKTAQYTLDTLLASQTTQP